ncbi:MAG: response regulator [Kiritimatiellia bacterium]
MKTTSGRKKVLIVDDHPLLREGLGRVINQQPDLVVCGGAADESAGLAAVKKLRPDVVIADISLEEGSGLDLIKTIHDQHPDLPILALSMHHEDVYAERALHAGASGYVMKRDPVSHVVAALRKLLNGQMAVSDSIVGRIMGRSSRNGKSANSTPVEALSNRELEIFRALGEGRGTKEIARMLHLAVSTVESYRAGIKKKLHLRTAPELVSSATRFVAEESAR